MLSVVLRPNTEPVDTESDGEGKKEAGGQFEKVLVEKGEDGKEERKEMIENKKVREMRKKAIDREKEGRGREKRRDRRRRSKKEKEE